MTIPIEIQRNSIAVGSRAGLVGPALAQLERELTYDHRIFLRGQAARDEFGNRRPVKIVPTRLYDRDEFGRLCTRVGFLDRAIDVLSKFNQTVTVSSLNPPHPRPDRYTVDWDGVFSTFDLRSGQDLCLCSILDNIHGGTVVAPPGFGKSYLFRVIGKLLPKANILIVCTRKDIVEEIYRGMVANFPNVGVFYEGRKRPGRISVATIQSAHNVPPEDVDILIGDEAHELLSDDRVQRLVSFPYSRNYAFSASPEGRADQADLRMEFVFGPVIYDMSYQEAEASGLVVPIKVKWVDVATNDDPCGEYTDTAKERAGIWRHDYRNALIAQEANAFGPDEQVLIMVRFVDHAVHLKSLLPDFTLAYSEGGPDSREADMAMYKRWKLIPEDEPQMTAQRRQMLKQQFSAGTLKKVIATDVWSTGVNFPNLQVLIRADAKASPIVDTQLPGRISRPSLATGKSSGLIIDFLDQFNTSYRDAARKRMRDYKVHGWEQILPPGNRRMRD